MPWAVPQPPNRSPQFVMPFSLSWVQRLPPVVVFQMPWSTELPFTYHKYISLWPGTTANSPRYKRQLGVLGVAGQLIGVNPPGWLFRRFQLAPSLEEQIPCHWIAAKNCPAAGLYTTEVAELGSTIRPASFIRA